jgi:hypothetical protein
MGRGFSWLVFIIGSLMLVVQPASASITTYTDSTVFNSAIAGYTATTVNFDSLTGLPITPVPSIGGITFSGTFSVPGEDLAILNTFDTTSPLNYLGTTDPSGAFFPGDTLKMDFSPVNALGMFIIIDSTPFAGDFSLITSQGTALSSATVEETLTGLGGGNVIFLGLTSPSTFNSATLSIDPSAGYQYNVDDITTASQPPAPTPEPGTFVLLGSGFVLFFRRFRKA